MEEEEFAIRDEKLSLYSYAWDNLWYTCDPPGENFAWNNLVEQRDSRDYAWENLATQIETPYPPYGETLKEHSIDAERNTIRNEQQSESKRNTA